ncbi:MAG: DNA polymerase III subunit gamma/tau [Bacteroidia bacterium]|nr:DNA polymerase III subunit gamma/tau [Bacteroidia bacterium]
MENYIVSARKYRPATFETVVGQTAITTTLKNAIKSKHLAHAYLFCGPRGIGKTTCARIYAKVINCSNVTDRNEPCNTCESCKAFNDNRSYNIHELDAASNNTVDDIRQIVDQVRIPPQIGKYKVYIIDEVHMLSSGAFNAFLKTLEEPPAHAIFILATTEKHKIIPTILSRCQIYDFNRIKMEDIVKHLEYVAKNEGVSADSDALNIIAQKSEGSMRDALSFFDQIVSFSGGNITYESALTHLNVLDYEYFFNITDFFLQNNISEALMMFDEILNKGFDGHHFITGIAEHFRDLLVSRDTATLKLLEVGDTIRVHYKTQAQKCSVDFLFKALKICSHCDIYYKASKNQRLHVELALIQLCNITNSESQSKQETPNISVPKTTKQETSAATEKMAVVSEPKPKPYSTPKNEKKQEDVNLLKESVSIKEAAKTGTKKQNESKPEEVKQPETELSESFTQELLREKWLAFAEKLKEEKPRLYNTMHTHMPELKEEFMIEIAFNNQSQSNAIREVVNELTHYLMNELKNTKIQLAAVISEKEGTQTKKLYTDSEKFNYLNEKNPNLGLLQKTLNLDFK